MNADLAPGLVTISNPGQPKFGGFEGGAANNNNYGTMEANQFPPSTPNPMSVSVTSPRPQHQRLSIIDTV